MSDMATLYHGTGQIYEGTPTHGRDVLGTGLLSLTTQPEIAEFFAGGGRDGRVYSLQIPKNAVLDLRAESEKAGQTGDWQSLAAQIKKAQEDGQFKAVAITDITFGGDVPEFRLLHAAPPDSWQVRPSEDSQENYGEFDDIVRRFNAGEPISKAEQMRVKKMLKEDAQNNIPLLRVLEQEGYPAAEAVRNRVLSDAQLYRSIGEAGKATNPTGKYAHTLDQLVKRQEVKKAQAAQRRPRPNPNRGLRNMTAPGSKGQSSLAVSKDGNLRWAW